MIGENIKKYRTLLGITQRELADRLHYSASYICDIETGRTIPTVRTLQAFAEEFEVDISLLIGNKCCLERINSTGDSLYGSEAEICKTCPLKALLNQKRSVSE